MATLVLEWLDVGEALDLYDLTTALQNALNLATKIGCGCEIEVVDELCGVCDLVDRLLDASNKANELSGL